MKLILIFILLLKFDSASAFLQPDSFKIRPGYEDSLRNIVTCYKMNHVPSTKQIEFCIPETDKESYIFFLLDYDKQSENEFAKLSNDIVQLCLEGDKNIIRKFIVLSKFVDGYFAEDYFDNADKIYKKRRNVFCEVFKKIDESGKTRLIAHGLTCR